MGMIINIDEALKLRTDYNILREPLNEMIKSKQEEWEKSNPIDYLFVRGTLSTFQETYSSSIGFDHAFAETADMTVGPIFNTAEGFSATYRSRTFQGGFIISKQTLEDGQMSKARDDALKFTNRWHGDCVEYCMTAISGGFGSEVTWGTTANGGISRLKLTSADTTDGTIDGTKNALFSNAHTIVKREGMTDAQVTAAKQSNMFRAAVDTTNTDITAPIVIGSSDPGQIAKLADFIHQVISAMGNYKDDNNKRCDFGGSVDIIAPNDAHLTSAISAALSMPTFGDYPNPALNKATLKYTSYLNDITQCSSGKGFFIVNKAYNSENHGPEFTERIPFTLDVQNQTRPSCITYDGRQRFDINCASWRGIAFCSIDAPEGSTTTAWNYKTKFTNIVPVSTIVKPVSVIGTVSTEEVT